MQSSIAPRTILIGAHVLAIHPPDVAVATWNGDVTVDDAAAHVAEFEKLWSTASTSYLVMDVTNARRVEPQARGRFAAYGRSRTGRRYIAGVGASGTLWLLGSLYERALRLMGADIELRHFPDVASARRWLAERGARAAG